MKKKTKSLIQVKQDLRRGATVVPLMRQLPAGSLSPVDAYTRLCGNDSGFLLESVEGGKDSARYSFIGARPFETLSVKNGKAFWAQGSLKKRLPGNPFAAIDQRINKYRALKEPGLPPFTGGAIGHIGYEMAQYLEPSLAFPNSKEPQALLRLFSDIIAFDRIKKRLVLIANVISGQRPLRQAYRRANDALDEMEELLSKPTPGIPSIKPKPMPAAKASLGRARFMEGVRRLKREIRRGEIFQAVLSDSFELPISCPPFEIYRSLRGLNPSPYMFYIGDPTDAVLGASPEMLVRAQGRALETHPIAGTRPRGKTGAEDKRNQRNLLASVKERAEHVMLVDLGRNDIGRVSVPGSVHVPQFMGVERYSHVMHLVSKVRGRLAPDASAWEAFGSCFPAGTVTGAPKIRAMQLVGAIENKARGFYAGAVVYRDFHGNVDSAIAIRSLAVRRGKARVQAGAGIVADSRPEAEWREIQAKAGAMFAAIRLAEARK